MLATACATSSRLFEGRHALALGNPEKALPLLRVARTRDPGNPILLRELGVAAYKSAEYDSACEALKQAVVQRRRDARALFYLGAAYESSQHYGAAVETYRQYTIARGSKRERQQMQKRLDALTLRQLQIDSRRALASETQLPGDDDPRTIAVTPFDAAGFAPEWSKVGRGVAVLVMNDLAQVKSLRVVDRLQLNVLLREIALVAPPGVAAQPAMGTSGQAVQPAPEPPPAAEPVPDVQAARSMTGFSPITTVAGIEQRLAIVKRPPSDPEKPGQPYYSGPVKETEDLDYFNAVTAFQADQGLVIDGIAGQKTRQAIEAAAQAALGARAATAPQATRVEPRREDPPPMPDATVRTVELAPPPVRSIDSRGAPRVGRILRAHTLVTGSVQALPGSDLRIDALPNSLDGAAFEPGSAQARGDMTRLFDLEKRIVFDVAERKMRLTLSDAERRAILGNKAPSLAAFLIFCDGLELEAGARYEEAAAQFRQAASVDPGFRAARDAAQRNADLVAADQLPDPETLFDPPADREELGLQLDHSQTDVGLGHVPGDSEDTETRPAGIGDPPTPPRPR